MGGTPRRGGHPLLAHRSIPRRHGISSLFVGGILLVVVMIFILLRTAAIPGQHSTVPIATASHVTQRPRDRPQLGLPVWWFAPFYDQSSFGQEASSYMLSLKREGLVNDSQLWIALMANGCNFELGDAMPAADHADLEAMLHYPSNETTQPAIVVCHNVPWFMSLADGTGHGCQPCPPRGYKPAVTIVRAMAEVDRYHMYSVRALNKADEVWVPTNFSSLVLRASGVRSKIRVLPQGFNTSFFDPAKHRPAPLPMGTQVLGSRGGLRRSRRRPFVYISVFKWETRKGWDVLLAAYLSEFSSFDNVELYIVSHGFLNSTDISQTIQRYAAEHVKKRPRKLPRVFLVSSFVTNAELASFYRASDVFVLPTRGEGWGRPASEAMAMGVPAIITDWSGPSEFVSEQNGYPLRYQLAMAEVNAFTVMGAKWAEPSREHLQALLRHTYTWPREVKKKGRAARALMVAKYSSAVVAEGLLRNLHLAEQAALQRKKQAGSKP